MLVNTVQIFAADFDRHVTLAYRDLHNTNPYQVKSIEGLGADNIVAKYSGAGGILPTLKDREVVILLGLNPGYDPEVTYSSLRDDVYRLIGGLGSGGVFLVFSMDAVGGAFIIGSITKVEPTYFEQSPVLKITVDCTRFPQLSSMSEVDGLLTSTIGVHGETIVNDDISTAAHGFDLTVRFTGTATSFEIDLNGSLFGVSGYSSFLNNDVLRFSSVANKKSIDVTTASGNVKLADKINSYSVWLMMNPGANTFTFDSDGTFEIQELTYSPLFWGI